MIKVLFVCLGNICRSPLAEGIFNAKVKSMGLDKHLQSDSAGTSDYHIGELPDDRTLVCAKRKGIAIQHRGRQVHHTDFRDFAYIVAMDEHNLKNLNQLKENTAHSTKEVYLMRNFVNGTAGLPVPDPYYGGEKEFEEVYTILDKAVDGLLNHLKEAHPQLAVNGK
ncbi:MAG: low molecular weight phosphotyrosine protein phosphatase [Algoriphagus sp.]|nr:low molecular weight phosphotyrosine protein phosphatase [Algoriphagus sp.]